MKWAAALFVLAFASNVGAQGGYSAPTRMTMRVADFVTWARGVQLQNTGTSPFTGEGQLEIIQGGSPPAALVTLQDDLAHGGVDCTGTFLCIGATNRRAQNVRVLMGENLEALYTPRLECRWVGFSWAVANICPEQYVVKDAPKTSAWFWTTRTGEYLVSGPGLDGGADRVEVVAGNGFLAGLRDAMMLGRVFQTARRVGGGGYGGVLETTYTTVTYANTAAVVARVLGENDVTVLGAPTPALEAAVRAGRTGGFGGAGAINVIAARSHYPNFGPCRPLFGRPVNYYLFNDSATQPQGALVIVRRAGAYEVISGSLVDGVGTRPTVGIRGDRYVQRLIEQLNLKAIIDQTYSPSEAYLGFLWLPCR